MGLTTLIKTLEKEPPKEISLAMTEQQDGDLFAVNFTVSLNPNQSVRIPLMTPRTRQVIFLPMGENPLFEVWKTLREGFQEDPLTYLGLNLHKGSEYDMGNRVSLVTGWLIQLHELEKGLKQMQTEKDIAIRIGKVGDHSYDAERLARIRIVDSYYIPPANVLSEKR